MRQSREFRTRFPSPTDERAGRAEDLIRHAKDSGHGRCPLGEFDISQASLMLVQIVVDILAWTRLLALTGDANIPRVL